MVPAAAAVVAVGLDVGDVRSAIGVDAAPRRDEGINRRALGQDAGLAERAHVTARPAVVKVGTRVGASRSAGVQRPAVGQALTLRAYLPRPTDKVRVRARAAGAAVRGIVGKVGCTAAGAINNIAAW